MKYSQLRQIVNLMDQRGVSGDVDVKIFVVEHGLPGMVSLALARDPSTDTLLRVDVIASDT